MMMPLRMGDESQVGAGQQKPNTIGGQLRVAAETGEFSVGDVGAHIAGIYDAVAETVDACMGGPVAFAALLEQGAPDVSRRLRRADDSKGQVQRAPIDYLAAIATDLDARLVLVNKLCVLWGLKTTEAQRALTAEEKLRLVSAELSEKRLRQIERENGLAAGSLDR